jgi:glycosyltransferase involved in cell wall biosynthesis
MDQTDYLIFPTFHDTFGFVSIEALASGTPVIATDTCAQPEIVIDGETGWLLPFENDSEVGKWTWIYRQREPGYVEAYAAQVEALGKSITERLESCWQDRDAYERLSVGALRHARDRFDIEKIRRRTEQIYDKCRRSE